MFVPYVTILVQCWRANIRHLEGVKYRTTIKGWVNSFATMFLCLFVVYFRSLLFSLLILLFHFFPLSFTHYKLKLTQMRFPKCLQHLGHSVMFLIVCSLQTFSLLSVAYQEQPSGLELYVDCWQWKINIINCQAILLKTETLLFFHPSNCILLYLDEKFLGLCSIIQLFCYSVLPKLYEIMSLRITPPHVYTFTWRYLFT
jgi:hypothetical protein